MFNNKKPLFILIILIIVLPVFVSAQIDKGNPPPDDSVSIVNPINVGSVEDFIAKILDIIVTIGTPIVVLFVIYAGFLFVKAQGKPEAINNAKETFLYTIIGAIILLGASVISDVIKNTVEEIKDSSYLGEEVDLS